MRAQEQYRAFMTIFRKEIRRFLRIWVQTLIPPVITMVLYFLIFGQLIGQRIGEMGGVDYMSFVVPGLIMMAVINNAYSNVVSSFYSAKFTKSVEELLVSPTPNYIILLGYVAGGIARGLAVGAIVTAVALFFTPVSIDNIGLTVLVVILTAFLFASAGLVNAIFANSFDDISIIPTFVLTPLTYLGGVFFAVDALPGVWQNVTYANPILYLVSTFRYGILGGEPEVNVLAAIVGIMVFVAGVFSYALYLLSRGKKLRA